ncbi:MAG TPA: hypothetical protein VKE70_27430, partial [Candidatus Solibacter sp.]|nr:hypothetical protein [Candidatus Solibacter sp.]
PGKMRQTRAAPAASIHKTRYVTPPQPEKRCKLAGRTYGMPFVSLILIRNFRNFGFEIQELSDFKILIYLSPLKMSPIVPRTEPSSRPSRTARISLTFEPRALTEPPAVEFSHMFSRPMS